MAYERQTFIDNKTILTAEMLDHIEGGIVANEEAIGDIETALDNIIEIQEELMGGGAE